MILTVKRLNEVSIRSQFSEPRYFDELESIKQEFFRFSTQERGNREWGDVTPLMICNVKTMAVVEC